MLLLLLQMFWREVETRRSEKIFRQWLRVVVGTALLARCISLRNQYPSIDRATLKTMPFRSFVCDRLQLVPRPAYLDVLETYLKCCLVRQEQEFDSKTLSISSCNKKKLSPGIGENKHTE